MKKIILIILATTLLFSCEKEEEAVILTHIIDITGENVIAAEEEYQYNCEIRPTNATNQVVEWSVSDTSLLAISDSGIVVGKKSGDAIIYAKTTDGTNLSAQKSVTIIGKPKVTLTINQDDIRYYKASFQLSGVNLNLSDEFKNEVYISNSLSIDSATAVYAFKITQEILDNGFVVTGLNPESKYYAQAYTENHELSKEYSNKIEFTTPEIDLATISNSSMNQVAGGGYVKVIDEYIFYRNFKDNNKLYRYNTLTHENIKILDETNVFSIHQYKNYLILGSNKKVLQCKFDGSSLKTIHYIKTFDNFVMQGDNIFLGNVIYITDYSYRCYLAKYDLTNNTYTEMGSWAYSINLENEYLYYKDRNYLDVYNIKRTNITNNSTETLLTYEPEGYIYRVIYYEGRIYFYTSRGLLGRFSEYSSTDLSFYNSKVNGFIIHDDWIYFSNEDDNNSLYKMDLNEQSIIKLNDRPVSSWLSIFNDELYFYSENQLYKINLDGTGEQALN